MQFGVQRGQLVAAPRRALVVELAGGLLHLSGCGPPLRLELQDRAVGQKAPRQPAYEDDEAMPLRLSAA